MNNQYILSFKDTVKIHLVLFTPLIWIIIKYLQNDFPDNSSFDDWFFNSDSIFYHSVSKDMILNKGQLVDWYFPAAPSLFPSLLIVYIINLFTENVYLSNLLFVCFQVLQLYILLLLLLKYFTDQRYAVFFGFVIFSFTIIIFDFVPFLYYSKVDHHFGNFLNLLFCLFLTINQLFKPKNLYAIGLFSLLAISTISNPLIISQFSMPMILALTLIEKIEKNNRSLLMFIIASSSVIGFLIKGIFFNNDLTDVVISYKQVINSLYHIKVFFTQNSTIFQNSILIPFIYFIFISLTRLFKKPKIVDLKNHFLILFVSASFITSIIVVLFSPVNIQFRYIINIYYLSIITSIILLYPFINDFYKSHNKIFTLYFTFFLFIIIAFKTDFSKKLSFNYYPDSISHFDNLAKEKKLKFGVADYWDANRLYVLSKSDLRGVSPVKIDKDNKAKIRKFNTSKLWAENEIDFSYNIHPKSLGISSYELVVTNKDSIYVFK